MDVSDESKYPEHDKLKAISDDSQTIGEFLDNCGYTLCEFRESPTLSDYSEFVPLRKSIQDVLAEYFGIDLNLIEKEKRAMLEELCKRNS